MTELFGQLSFTTANRPKQAHSDVMARGGGGRRVGLRSGSLGAPQDIRFGQHSLEQNYQNYGDAALSAKIAAIRFTAATTS